MALSQWNRPALRLSAPTLALIAAVLGTPAQAPAQEPDFLRPPIAGGSLRFLALGGAYVGLADDAGTVTANPAGLMAVPRSFEVVAAPHGFEIGGDDHRPRHAALAFHPSPWVGVGAGWQQDAIQSLVPTGGLDRLDSWGSMWFTGAAFAFPDRRFSGGVSGEWRRLLYRDETGDRIANDFAWTAGVLFNPESREVPRLGLRYVSRSDWTLADERHVRIPSVISAGISWHYGGVLSISDALLTVQADRVQYPDLTPGADPEQRARPDLDIRVGVELTFPFDCYTGCGSMLQIRAGIHNAAPVPFDTRPRAQGEAVGQGPARTNSWAVGAAIYHRAVLRGRIKLEVTYDRRADALGVGVGWRYPEAYRAEIEDRTRR